MRRSLWAGVAGLAWLSLAAQPLLAAQPDALTGGGSTETLTGTLEVAHADDFAHARAERFYWLRTSAGRVRLEFAGKGPEEHGGARVRITGRRSGQTLTVAASRAGAEAEVLVPAASNPASALVAADGFGTTAAATTAEVTAAAPVAKTVAVILVNFSNDASQPFLPATAASLVFSNGNSVANFFAEESRGALSISGQVFGWFTIPATNANCAWSTWGAQAKSAAAAAGVNFAAFTNVVYAWPHTTSCGWAGLGYMPGSSTFNNGAFNVRVVAHELSHNLGINHASSLSCASAGVRVALSATCTYSEYGDPFTVMGSGSWLHNAGQQIGELGWLSPGEVQTVSPGGTYQLAAVLGSPAGTVKVLRIARGDGTWIYIDVRASLGPYFDAFAAGSAAVSGVTIRLSPDGYGPTLSPRNTMLVDAHPETTTFADAPLRVGERLVDPVGQFAITTVSVDGLGASVQVLEAVAPSAPGSLTVAAPDPTDVELAWTGASDNVGVAGYRIVRDGIQLATTDGTARSYHDGGLAAQTTYAYQVLAVDGSANVGPAAGASVTTPADGTVAPPPPPPPPPPAADTQPPTAPRSLHARKYSATVTRLTWLAATDNVKVVRYRIYRVGRSRPVATTAARWAKIHRVSGALYYIRAVDGAGNQGVRSNRVRAY
jgi:hypothetical protein